MESFDSEGMLRGERGRKIDRRRWRIKGDFSSGSNLGFAERDLWSNDGKTLSCNGASKAAHGFVRKSLRRCRCSFCVAEKESTEKLSSKIREDFGIKFESLYFTQQGALFAWRRRRDSKVKECFAVREGEKSTAAGGG